MTRCHTISFFMGVICLKMALIGCMRLAQTELTHHFIEGVGLCRKLLAGGSGFLSSGGVGLHNIRNLLYSHIDLDRKSVV